MDRADQTSFDSHFDMVEFERQQQESLCFQVPRQRPMHRPTLEQLEKLHLLNDNQLTSLAFPLIYILLPAYEITRIVIMQS